MNRGGIRVFAALVRAGSLSLAGRELKMEHSTVVRRIDAAGHTELTLAGADQLPKRDMWLVIHPEVRRSTRVRLVADLVTEVVTSAAHLFNPQDGTDLSALPDGATGTEPNAFSGSAGSTSA